MSVPLCSFTTIDRKVCPMDAPEPEIVISQKDENLKTWCPSSGENARRMTPPAGSDAWKVQFPAGGRRWRRGRTTLVDQDQP